MKWISTKHRLPKENGLYITYKPKWRISDGYGERVSNSEPVNGIELTYFDEKGFYKIDGNTFINFYDNQITHWMKLPEAPSSRGV